MKETRTSTTGYQNLVLAPAPAYLEWDPAHCAPLLANPQMQTCLVLEHLPEMGHQCHRPNLLAQGSEFFVW
jgi:hypothetical protein